MPTLSGSTISVRTNSPKPRAFRAALASLSSLVNPKISLSQHTTLGGHHRCDTLPVRYSKKGTFFPWPSDTRVDMEPSCQPKPLQRFPTTKTYFWLAPQASAVIRGQR